MISERSEREARVGAKVRVLECSKDPELRGLVGEVARVYGGSDYGTVVDVRFEDGRSSLFWAHELEQNGERRSFWWRSLFHVGRR